MQFSCSNVNLIEGLQTVTKALAVRTTNSILEGILIETNEEGVMMTCTDERLTIVTQIEANVIQHGRGVVPGKLFNEIIRRMPDGLITISMNERFIFRISSAASRMNIAGQDADLFPALPQMEDARSIVLPQNMLRDMIQKTEFAIATEDMREILTGCLLEINNGNVNMVALDGYRMALCKSYCSNVDATMNAIIPGRAVGDIGKLLSDDSEALVELYFGGNKLHLKLENTEIFVILVEGEYINYRQILPGQFATKVIVELDDFRRCVDRAALIAREGNNNLLLLRIANGELIIEAHSQIGDVHEELEIAQDGADINIAFNVKYLIDVVKYISADRIEININSAISPCVITPVGDPNYLHLVLPVRTSATA